MADTREAELRGACASLVHHVGWTRALALLNFVLGGLLALTLVGLVLAWFFIWLGVVLNRAAKALDEARARPEHFDAAMAEAMRQVAFHFIMQVMMLLGLLGLGVVVSLFWPGLGH
jgi:hypothetical protein